MTTQLSFSRMRGFTISTCLRAVRHLRLAKLGKSWFLLALFFVLFPSLTFAAPASERPLPYWGRAQAEWGSGNNYRKIYSDPEATIVIRNLAPKTLPEMLFNTECVLNADPSISRCFYLAGQSATKLYNSRSYANDYLKSAVAVLLYPKINITGDSYSADTLGNFSYWGRHLRKVGDSSNSNAFWQAKNYQFNPAAQAIWNGGTTYAANVDRISASARRLDGEYVSSSGAWLLPTFWGVCGKTANCTESGQYPEGRIWSSDAPAGLIMKNLNLSYFNRSTVVVESGDFTLSDSNISYFSNGENEKTANFGLIIKNGNVNITSSAGKAVKIYASIFAPNGNIHVSGDNITLVGSFVAKDFIVNGGNINFVYDSRAETTWPPGFRELELPSVFNQ